MLPQLDVKEIFWAAKWTSRMFLKICLPGTNPLCDKEIRRATAFSNVLRRYVQECGCSRPGQTAGASPGSQHSVPLGNAVPDPFGKHIKNARFKSSGGSITPYSIPNTMSQSKGDVIFLSSAKSANGTPSGPGAKMGGRLK